MDHSSPERKTPDTKEITSPSVDPSVYIFSNAIKQAMESFADAHPQSMAAMADTNAHPQSMAAVADTNAHPQSMAAMADTNAHPQSMAAMADTNAHPQSMAAIKQAMESFADASKYGCCAVLC